MKKLFTIITVMLISIALAACADLPETDNSLPIAEQIALPAELTLDTSRQTEITFLHRMGTASEAILTRWVSEFEAEYPNIKVNAIKDGANYDELVNNIALRIAAQNTPDLSESYPDHVARYATGNVALALNPFIEHPTLGYTQGEIDDFLPSLWAEGSKYDTKGTMMSVPFTKSSEALFYNAGYFAQKGYSVPTTWEEVFALAEIIKADEEARNPEVTTVPFGYDSDSNLFITASEQWGAPYTGYTETGAPAVLFNNDESKNMIEYFKDKYDRGLMLTQGTSGSYTSDIFKTGSRLYMYVGSTGGTRYALEGMAANVFNGGEFKVGVASVPHFEGKNPAQILQGPNLSLFNPSGITDYARLSEEAVQKMVASWLFVKFVSTPERSAEFSIPSGYAPIRYSSYNTAAWLEYVDGINPNPTTIPQAVAKLIKEAIEVFSANGENFFTSTVFNLSSKTRTEVGALLVKIMIYQNFETPQELRNFINAEYARSYNFITT